MAQIVLIDSEPTVRAVVTRILTRAGHSVRATGEFQEALQWLHSLPAELILTNVFLKDITGSDAMRRIKEEFPGTPVLMVSGLPDSESIAQWTEESKFDIFPKPFTGNALLQKISQMLATNGSHSTAGQSL
jgi:DNA-binding NtrC family response regulator